MYNLLYRLKLNFIMKYIKYYESKISRTKEIEDFAKYNLAFLIDDGFECSVNISRKPYVKSGSYDKKLVMLSEKKFDTIVLEKKFGFFLDDVKDDLISFVDFLDDKYNIEVIYYVIKKVYINTLDKKTISYIDYDISIRKIYFCINK